MKAGLWSCLILLAGASLLAAPRGAPSQRCGEPHYRWSVKTDTSLAGRPAVGTTVTEILTRWTTLALGKRDDCAPRAGREREVFEVSGWIRRMEKVKDDGDWHIEVTAGPTSPTDSCIVAEIPVGELGAVFGRARTQLDALLAGRRLGRCNSSLRALWEVHPVYAVSAPQP